MQEAPSTATFLVPQSVQVLAAEQAAQSASIVEQAVQTLALSHEVPGQVSIQDYLSTANFLVVHAVQAL